MEFSCTVGIVTVTVLVGAVTVTVTVTYYDQSSAHTLAGLTGPVGMPLASIRPLPVSSVSSESGQQPA